MIRMIVFCCCFEVFFSPYIVGFLHVAVIGSFWSVFPVRDFAQVSDVPWALIEEWRSKEEIRRCEFECRFVVHGLRICDVIGEPRCRCLHIMNLITSFIHLMNLLHLTYQALF